MKLRCRALSLLLSMVMVLTFMSAFSFTAFADSEDEYYEGYENYDLSGKTIIDFSDGRSEHIILNEEQREVVFKFVPDSTDYYKFMSFDNVFYEEGEEFRYNTYTRIYCEDDNSNLIFLTSDEDSGYNSNFAIIQMLEAGKTYYFVASLYHFKDGAEFSVSLERTVIPESAELTASSRIGYKSLEYGNLVRDWSWDEETDDSIPSSDYYFRYFDPYPVDGDVLVVYFSDGSQERYTYSEYEEWRDSDGKPLVGSIDYTWEQNQSYENQFKPGTYNIIAHVNLYGREVASNTQRKTIETNPDRVFENGILYAKDEDEVCVLQAGSVSGNIEIPESVSFGGTSYPVKSIGSHAFRYRKELTGITIPKTITKIFDSAFALTGLKQITIPDSVYYIGRNAFGIDPEYIGDEDIISTTVVDGFIVYAVKGSAAYGWALDNLGKDHIVAVMNDEQKAAEDAINKARNETAAAEADKATAEAARAKAEADKATAEAARAKAEAEKAEAQSEKEKAEAAKLKAEAEKAQAEAAAAQAVADKARAESARADADAEKEKKIEDLQAQLDTLKTQMLIVKSLKVTAIKGAKVKVSFKSLGEGFSYEVKYSSKEKKGFKKAKGLETNNSTFKIKKLKKGKTYYIKVRAYKTIGEKRVYTKYSTVKKFKAK